MKNKLLIAVSVICLLFSSNVTYATVNSKTNLITSEKKEENLGQEIADFAIQYVGNPYVWGGKSLTNGADCSGFALAVMANFDIEIERVANDQFQHGEIIDIENRQPGDLIFYGYESSYADHTAIYIGNNQIVHAKSSAEGIVISDYDYWNYIGVRRYW